MLGAPAGSPVKPTAFVLVAAWAVVVPAAAQAGAAACWFEEGAVVVPAVVAGVAGDYILDTGTPTTQLHETRAQGAGFIATALTGEVRVAGERLAGRPVAVVDLDPRTWAFRTPIAGVIGADVLAGYVVDVSFAPCRVALYRPGHEPAFGRGLSLPMRRLGGLPVVTARVSDGASVLEGDFVPASGADTAVRLDPRLAQVPGAARAQDVAPYGARRAQVAALTFAGRRFERVAGGLLDATDAPGAAGVVGAPALALWRLRFDFPRGRLRLAPAR